MWCSYAPAPMKLRYSPSSAARPRMRRVSSSSFRPVGTLSRPTPRSVAGISSNSASTESTPSAASMARTSSSVCGMKGMASELVLVRGGRFVISRGVEQLRELCRVARPNAEHPRAVRILVHFFRRVGELGVRGDDFARHRCVDVRRGFHGFDDGALLALLHLAPRRRRLDEHHVAELLLRVIGDADRDGAVGLLAYPLVGGGVFQLTWCGHL